MLEYFLVNNFLWLAFFLCSPRSTGSASSNNSLYKRKYSPQIDPQRELSQTALLASNAKRIAYNNTNSCMLYCIYCTKNDFENMEQLHLHVQQMHAIVLQEVNKSRSHSSATKYLFIISFFHCISRFLCHF